MSYFLSASILMIIFYHISNLIANLCSTLFAAAFIPRPKGRGLTPLFDKRQATKLARKKGAGREPRKTAQ
ncbi:MAG: hypothetical protein J5938_04525, partial [Clostridia bacterium]|nr:hypothetical protein [Clostridia bacterium]